MEYCKNCGKPVKDLYCSHCGQKILFGRITFMYIWHQIFHFFTHIEHGFLYTSIRMLSSPGKTVTEYIDGRRKIYQPPVSYFLIWTTIFILFSNIRKLSIHLIGILSHEYGNTGMPILYYFREVIGDRILVP